MRKLRQFYWLMLACSPRMAAQTKSHPAVMARMVVTSTCYCHEPPGLATDDIILTHEYEPLPITALTPLQGARADLELFVLVDGHSNFELGEKLAELRQFLASQAPTTSIGVAYIQNGRLEVAQEPTPDRAGAIRLYSRIRG
jgi:hypothetical protein